MQESITKAITVLQQGGIVIYPTDTAFGIGCRIDNEQSIQRLFKLRKRPESQATPVLVSGIGMAEEFLTDIPEDVTATLLRQYWPGALTVVLACKIEKVPELVRGGTHTLGVRMPNHETTLALINGLGVPLLGPSANFHGEATPFSVAEVNKELSNLVDYVVEGECTVKQASTVIDCTRKPWNVLRYGAEALKGVSLA